VKIAKKQSMERAFEHHTRTGLIRGWHYNAQHPKPWSVDSDLDRYTDDEAFGICTGLALAARALSQGRAQQEVTGNAVRSSVLTHEMR
jgi:hypothetical protein